MVQHCRSASARPFGCFDGSAAADPPGLRPFRRGWWRLAQGAVVRSMLLLENRLHFLTNSGWCTRTRSSCEVLFALAMKFACGSWKQAQGNCTHVSAVIGGEGLSSGKYSADLCYFKVGWPSKLTIKLTLAEVDCQAGPQTDFRIDPQSGKVVCGDLRPMCM